MWQWFIEKRTVPGIHIFYLRNHLKLIFIIENKIRRETIYCEVSGKVYNIKNYPLKSLLPAPMTVQKFPSLI